VISAQIINSSTHSITPVMSKIFITPNQVDGYIFLTVIGVFDLKNLYVSQNHIDNLSDSF